MRPNSPGLSYVDQYCRQLGAQRNVRRQIGTEYVIMFPRRDIKGIGNSLELSAG